MGLILMVLVILLLLGAMPTWGYSRDWGYGPVGFLGTLLLVVLLLMMLDVLPHGWSRL